MALLRSVVQVEKKFHLSYKQVEKKITQAINRRIIIQ